MKSSKNKQLQAFPFVLAALFLAGLFFASQVKKAEQKPFWLDEAAAFHLTIWSQSVPETLFHGPRFQGSKAPLDYVVIEFFDNIKSHVSYFGLHPMSYYRLGPNLAILLSGLVVFLYFFIPLLKNKKIKSPLDTSVLGLLYLFVLLSYLFHPNQTIYATEMRPYALWTGFWFLTIVLFFRRPKSPWAITAILCGLSLTATAAIFQMMALFLGLALFNYLDKKSWKDFIKESFILFTLPVLLCFYYGLLSGEHGYTTPEWGTWKVFFSFLKKKMWVPVCSLGLIGLCFLKKETRPFALPSVVMLILFCFSPLIFFITRSRGFFFSERQYLYFTLNIPLFYLTLACVYPYWASHWKKGWKRWIPQAAVLFLIGTAFVLYFGKKVNQAWAYTQAESRFYIPIDKDLKLTRLLEKELPKEFCLDEEDKHSVTSTNVIFVADWLPYRYPTLEKGKQTVFLTAGPENSVVNEIQEQECKTMRIPTGGNLKVGGWSETFEAE